MRLFIGFRLAESIVAQLRALCARLRSQTDGLRWSAPESWHITLQFLGNATPEQFESLAAKLSQVRSAPVPLQLGGLGIFDRAGVFLAKVDLSPQLIALQKRVTAATADCGFEPEDRPYQPHVTLARSKDEHRGKQLGALRGHAPTNSAFPGFTAREFLLYESHLGPGGSKYEVRRRFPLAASPRIGRSAG